MKYIIVLYLCSFVGAQPVCMPGQIQGLEFNNYSECILQGYIQSHKSLKSLDEEEINNNKLAIRFHCKEIIVEKI